MENNEELKKYILQENVFGIMISDKMTYKPNSMKDEEKCCGNCCWFIGEDAYGEGECVESDDDDCTMTATMCNYEVCKKYISRRDMRHHMAVLLLIKRWYAAPGGASCRIPSEDDMIKALDFAYRYMKVFNKL